ncbi:hypothetical protein ACJMQP_04225 [Rhodopseudomonas palustris]
MSGNPTADVAAQISASRSEWLEDVLAGLLAAGTPRDAIVVWDHGDGRTTVAVHGVQKYEWKYRLVAGR